MCTKYTVLFFYKMKGIRIYKQDKLLSSESKIIIQNE